MPVQYWVVHGRRWKPWVNWMSGSSGSQISMAFFQISISFAVSVGAVTYAASASLSNAGFFQREKFTAWPPGIASEML